MLWMRESSHVRVLVILFGTLLLLGVFVLLYADNKASETIAPSDESEASGWETSTDEESTAVFQYPMDFSTVYIQPVDWPPRVEVIEGAYSCVETGSEVAPGGKTEEREIGDRTYCVTRSSEGAAGSVYTEYTYASDLEGKTIMFTFMARAVQCQNYDEPDRSACEQERAAFTPDGIVDEMFKSLSFADA